MLTVVLADSYDELVPELVTRLSAPRPFASVLDQIATPEWVITPSLGVRRWLTAQVSTSLGAQSGRTDGIVANWQQDFPSRLTQRVLDAHFVAMHGIETDPWALPGLQFVVYDWAVANPGARGLELLTDGAGTVVLARCRHMADLFDRYITWRPAMVLGWLQNKLSTESSDEELQAELFRAVHAKVGLPCPAERWDETWAALPSYLDILPASDRVSIFGLSSLPGGLRYVEALENLARHLDVTLYLVRPFTTNLKGLDYDRERFSTSALQLWGGSGIALAEMIDTLVDRGAVIHEASPKSREAGSTLLASLQKSLRADVLDPAATDTSVIVHEAHGQARQAEILRDAIRHELVETRSLDEGGLTETDILVVCPRAKEFEPLIRTAFGPTRRGATSGDQFELAYKVSDRSLSHDGLYLQGVNHLLELVRSRCTRSEVLSFLAEPTVQRARRISDDGAELFAEWTRAAGIRWGLDAPHREQFGLATLGDVNTWRAGLRRLAFGAFMENPRLRAANSILPVEVAPTHFDELVNLAATVHDLIDAVSATWTPRPLARWLEWYDQSTRTFLSPGNSDTREYERVLGAIKPLRDAAELTTSPMPFSDFVWLLDEAFSSIGSVSSVLTGGVTITSPDTLRGIGFKSVYILGFDDDAFTSADWENTDLRRLSRQPGDLSPADDARGRLREIILAAGERLTVLRSGRNVVNNEKVEPGVAFSEFLEAVQALGGTPLTVAHPRNSYSPSNFDAEADFTAPLRGAGILSGPWSYSALDHSLAATDPTQRVPRSSLINLSAVHAERPDSLSLYDLEQFLRNPPQVFARCTLGIVLPGSELDRHDDLDISTRGLLGSQITRILLEEERAADDRGGGADLLGGLAAMVASGEAPPAPILDTDHFTTLVTEMARLAREEVSHGRRRQIPLSLDIDGVTLTGDVDVIQQGEQLTVIEVVTSGMSLRHLVSAWLRVTALRAALGQAVSLYLVYRPTDPGFGPVLAKRFNVEASAADAREVLSELIGLYRANLEAPIPFAVGDSLSTYERGTISEDRWLFKEYKKKYEARYLGDPYWELALGHLSVDEVVDDDSPTGLRRAFQSMKRLFDAVIPLYDFVKQDSGNS